MSCILHEDGVYLETVMSVATYRLLTRQNFFEIWVGIRASKLIIIR